MMRKALLSLAACASLVSTNPALADQPGTVEFLNSGKVVPTNLPFSEAVRAGNTLYLSGQIGIVPGTLKLAPGGIREEARQAMENIKASLEAHGYAMSDIVKCTVMLADISDYFEAEIDTRLHLLTTAVEPVIMIFMGLVVGVIIITMYLPIFKIAGTVG